MKRRNFLKTATATAVLATPAIRRACARAAPTRTETLLLVQEYGPNSLDRQNLGSAQPVNGVSLNCYDRLVRFKRKPIANSIMSFDINTLGRSWRKAGRKTAMACIAHSSCVPMRVFTAAPSYRGRRQVLARPCRVDRRFCHPPDGRRQPGKAGTIRRR